MATREIIYKSTDNDSVVSFYEDNVAMDFSAVTRVVLKLYNRLNTLQTTVDSADSPSLISWSGNEITFSINDVSIAIGLYPAQVIIYDATHPNGQVIAHPQSDDDLLAFSYVTA